MNLFSMRNVVLCISALSVTLLVGCSGADTPPQIDVNRNADPFAAATDAAFKGDLEYVKSCVESDARYVQGVDGLGKTLLHYAAEGGHKEIVEYLLQNGASVFVNDEEGYSPFDSATQGGASREIFDLLNAAGNAG